MDAIIPTLAAVLDNVDAFLERHPEIKETRLARDATGESSLISTMRDGRHPSLRTLLKLQAHMQAVDGKAALAEDVRPFSCPSLPDLPDRSPPREPRAADLVDAARMQ